MTRQHRHEAAYPDLWAAVDGGMKMAVHDHPEIEIPDKYRESLIKRIVGQVLSVKTEGFGKPDEKP